MSTHFVIVERKNMSGRYVALRGLSFPTKEAAQAHIDSAFNPRYRERFSIETRTIKVDDTADRMTCQCCNRAILANTGTIAHHGYERPDHGWQTASCFGAKRLPWQVDRSAVADLIKHLKSTLVRHVAARKSVANDVAPVQHNYTGDYDRRTGRSAREHVLFTRESFARVLAENPKAFRSHYGEKTYEVFKSEDLADRDAKIKHIKNDIKEFQSRYDGWKQTHKRDGDQWIAI